MLFFVFVCVQEPLKWHSRCDTISLQMQPPKDTAIVIKYNTFKRRINIKPLQLGSFPQLLLEIKAGIKEVKILIMLFCSESVRATSCVQHICYTALLPFCVFSEQWRH